MIESTEACIKFLVNTCINLDPDSTKEYRVAIGKLKKDCVENSRGQSEWDRRYNTLVLYGHRYGFKYLRIKRGGLWTAIAAYNTKTNEMFLLFKMENLNRIMKNPYEYHYLPIFNVGNKNQKPMQMSFSFEKNEEQLAEVLQDYESEYEKWISKFDIHPKRVIACGFTSDRFICRIYNSNQELVSQHNYSHLIDAKFDHLSNDNSDVTPPTKPKQGRNMRRIPKGRRIIGLRKRD